MTNEEYQALAKYYYKRISLLKETIGLFEDKIARATAARRETAMAEAHEKFGAPYLKVGDKLTPGLYTDDKFYYYNPKVLYIVDGWVRIGDFEDKQYMWETSIPYEEAQKLLMPDNHTESE